MFKRITLLAIGLIFLSACQHGNICPIFSRTETEKSLWAGWKNRYAVQLEQGTIIKDPYTGRYFSEAMGHALQLAVQFGDQSFFNSIVDGLQNYFKNKQGLYCWEIGVKGTHLSDQAKQVPATETELNVLVALLDAHELLRQKRWTCDRDYKKLAGELEKVIWEECVLELAGAYLFLPSDKRSNIYWPVVRQWNTTIVKKIAIAPTYFNLAFFRKIAKAYPEHPWGKVIETSIQILNTSIEERKELLASEEKISPNIPIPAWVWIESVSPNSIALTNYFIGNEYVTYSNEFDSIRMPMYIGLDVLWNDNPSAKKLLTTFVAKSKASKTEAAFVGAMPGYPNGWNSLLAISQFGVARKAAGLSHEAFRDQLKKRIHSSKEYFGTTPQYYYQQTFNLYGYLMLNDRFVNI